MEKILFVNACVRPDSRTLELARYVLKKLPGDVEELNLEAEQIRPHTGQSLARRNGLLAAGDHSDSMFRYAHQFRQADTVLIAAPYYDLSFPSSVKNWVESICNVGLTFYYDENEVAQSLCRGKRLIYVTTSGAEFVPDFGYEYIRRVFSEFFRIDEAVCFHGEKLDLRGAEPDAILAGVREKIDMFFSKNASFLDE